MGKKVLTVVLVIILRFAVGFFAGMVVQNGGFKGVFSFISQGEKTEDTVDMTGKTVSVGQNTANVYEKADANSKVIYSMSNGETATCVEQTDDWLKLEIIEGVYGYAHAKLFTLASDYSTANDSETQTTKTPEKTYVKPTVNVLDIYAGESSDYDIVATVESGAVLELTEKGQTWSKVTTLDGKSGYVMTEDIETTEYDPNAMVVEVTHSFVNLRSEASSDSDKVGSLSEGDTAEYLGEEENFYRIRTEDGTECYVSKDYTELKNTSGDSADTSSANNDNATE